MLIALLLSFLITNVQSCLLVRSVVVPMGSCKCPQIRVTDPSEIRANPWSAYLAGRKTVDAILRVTDNCEVLFKAPDMKEDHATMMMFQDDVPPVFIYRYHPNNNEYLTVYYPRAVQDLTCEQVGADYQWFYHGGLVKNISFAAQSNKDMCSCAPWKADPKGQADAYDGLCDVLWFRCDGLSAAAMYFSEDNDPHYYFINYWPDVIIDEAICVNSTWFYKGMPIKNPQHHCVTQVINPVDNAPDQIGETRVCNCGGIKNVYKDPRYLRIYKQTGKFDNYTLNDGSFKRTGACSGGVQSYQFLCSASDFMVIFSRNYKPMIYPSGSQPRMRCEYAEMRYEYAAAANPWFIDGIMLAEPAFACYSYPCACSFQYMDQSNIKQLVGNHPFYHNITSHTIRPLNDNCVDEKICPELMTCPEGLTLVVFDSETTVKLYPEGSLTSTCSPSTQKWTVSGAQLDRLYAVCVTYGCHCPYQYLDESNIKQLVGTNPFYFNVTAHVFQAPLDNCLSDGLCPSVVSCPVNHTLVIFDMDKNTVQTFPSGSSPVSCSESTYKWSVSGSTLSKLYSVCVNFQADPRRGCNCPAVVAQQSLANTLLHYKYAKTWAPIISYKDNCQVEFYCGNTDEKSYLTAFYDTYEDTNYINRVSNNVPTYLPEPRPYIGLKCDQIWFLHSFGTHSVKATCIADNNSCKCPTIGVESRYGELAVLDDRSNGTQCGFFKTRCPDSLNFRPRLFSDNMRPITSLGRSGVFDELVCLQTNDGSFKWHFDEFTLENPVVKCDLNLMCQCGNVTAITTQQQLEFYSPGDTRQLLDPEFDYSECQKKIVIGCKGNFVIYANGGVFTKWSSSWNWIECVETPADHRQFMWMFEGQKILDPAIACFSE